MSASDLDVFSGLRKLGMSKVCKCDSKNKPQLKSPKSKLLLVIIIFIYLPLSCNPVIDTETSKTKKNELEAKVRKLTRGRYYLPPQKNQNGVFQSTNKYICARNKRNKRNKDATICRVSSRGWSTVHASRVDTFNREGSQGVRRSTKPEEPGDARDQKHTSTTV